jgi:predicted metalloprotease
VPVTKVSTYAFVNPVIAVLIGVVTFHERLAPAELVGMVAHPHRRRDRHPLPYESRIDPGRSDPGVPHRRIEISSRTLAE